MALGFLRRHQRWFHVLLGVVILGFIFVYIPMFQDANAGAASEEVGRVAGDPIKAREYQNALRRLRNRYEQMSGRPLDENMLRMLGLENQVFDGLVRQRVIEIEARRHGLVVTEKDLARAAAAIPAFQDSGRFIGAERVRQFLESQGQSITEFEHALRQDLLQRQLEGLVTDGVTVSPAEVEEEFRRRNEEIQAEYVLVDTTRFTGQVTAHDEDVKARFESNKETYRVPEKRVASYVLVDPGVLRAQAAVTDAEISTRYGDRKDQYTEKEQVCARHVLIKTKDAAAKEGRTDEQAQRLATDLLAQLRAGADFAAIAKKSSDDPLSADKGGDLSCFPRGTMPNEFENVAFNLEENTISEPVKTGYGYHLIQVTQRRQEMQRPLAEVKEAIRAELSGQKAQAAAQQKADTVAAALARGTKLEEAARANGLEIKSSAPVSRGEPLPPFNEAVVNKLFELKSGETSPEPVALNDGFVFVSLAEVKGSHVPELADVQAQVKTDVIKSKAFEQSRARAQELKAKAASVGLAKAAAGLGLARKETTSPVRRGDPLGELGSGLELDETAFKLQKDALSDPIRTASGYAIVRVTQKKAFDPQAFEKEKASITATVRASKRNQLFDAYLTQARQHIQVERRTEALRRVAG